MHLVPYKILYIYPGRPPAAVAEGRNSSVGIEHYLPAQCKCLKYRKVPLPTHESYIQAIELRIYTETESPLVMVASVG